MDENSSSILQKNLKLLFDQNFPSIEFNTHITTYFNLTQTQEKKESVIQFVKSIFSEHIREVLKDVQGEMLTQVFDCLTADMLGMHELFPGIELDDMFISILQEELTDDVIREFGAFIASMLSNGVMLDFHRTLITLFFNTGHLDYVFEIEFSNCGAEGTHGPTSIGDYYKGMYHEKQVEVDTGIQTWTVPKNGYYLVSARGASGGNSEENPDTRPGYGAIINGKFFFREGEKIRILVGQMGQDGRGEGNRAGGGGGGTFVVSENNTPLIIAGGGNGCNWGSWTVNGPDALLYPREVPISKTNGRAGTGGSFDRNGEVHSSENGGISFTQGGFGGTGSCGDGGFGGGAGAQYEGGGGGGYEGGIVSNENQYGTNYPTYGATSFISDEGEEVERILHSARDHGHVTISCII